MQRDKNPKTILIFQIRTISKHELSKPTSTALDKRQAQKIMEER